jgi:hypothetical protein
LCQWLFNSQTLEDDDGDTLSEPRYGGGGNFHERRLSSVYMVKLSMSFTAATAGSTAPMQTPIESPGYSEVHTGQMKDNVNDKQARRRLCFIFWRRNISMVSVNSFRFDQVTVRTYE